MKPSQRPWEADTNRIFSASGTQVCDACDSGSGVVRAEQREANAAFIVRAVNAHDALVSALEAWTNSEYCDEGGEVISAADYWPAGYAQAVAALKLAKGES